jgi:glutamyl-tRNA synthetase
MSVSVRFAPSPTGFLHIGGARTALFNYLFARHHGGAYHLRIEDTDRKRSTEEAIDAILDGLEWLGLSGDEPPTFQHQGLERHAAVAQELIDSGHAYRCYCTPEELETMREQARAEKRKVFYDRRWRDRDPADAPDVPAVVRIKAPLSGETVIEDAVQGRVVFDNEQLDDMILLRADGTPTYMLSVVVDDFDMGITHVIRGDDHMNNAARQSLIFDAMGWQRPVFAHIPLIHGSDGAKLSKRHGALGVDAYRDMGFLPEALCNYLLRLGWSHGDDEVISREQAIEWFDLGNVGRSAARFDMDKLTNLNAHYIKEAQSEHLIEQAMPFLAKRYGEPDTAGIERIKAGLEGLRPRAKTLIEFADACAPYMLPRPLPLNEKAAKLLDDVAIDNLASLRKRLETLDGWQQEALEAAVRETAEEVDVKLGKLAQPLRAALTGSNVSPGIFDVMDVLGRDETLGRLDDALMRRNP